MARARRIAIVFNGSPLFTGEPGPSESNIRRWIIENDWLDAIIALPDQLFYNTGILTYIWIVTNRKEPRRRGKVQLIDGTRHFVKMRKSLGNKRNEIGDGKDGKPDHIGDLTRLYANFKHDEARTFTLNGKTVERACSKILANHELGYLRLTVDRPLRQNFQASPARIARVERGARLRGPRGEQETKGQQGGRGRGRGRAARAGADPRDPR